MVDVVFLYNANGEGNLVRLDSLTKPKSIERFSASQALCWLREIAFIRAFETKALELTQVNPPRVQGSMHFCAGQEAIPVGVLSALASKDQIIATYRGHGWALASGLEPREVMAEICQKKEGINNGRGGSAYMMAPWSRFIGENSIVGAGTTIACGVALANLASKNGQIVAVSIGDGALNQGSVHEALAFSSALSLPIIFVVENNGWSEMTATKDMFKIERLAQRAAGYGIPSATISGTDPFIIRDSVVIAAERARSGAGPSLLEFNAPRLWGHYNRDIEHYRSKSDRASAQSCDPLTLLAAQIIQQGVADEDHIQAIIEEQNDLAANLTEEVMNALPPSLHDVLDHVIAPALKTTPRVIERREMSYIEAVNTALRVELESDQKVIVYGEDVGKSGGIFQACRNLQRDFGEMRVFDTPIAENAILGSAVGAAISGLKPVVEIMWADFMFVALDQLVNQAANIRYLTSGRSSAGLVVRTQQGVTPGSCAQHSQSIEGILAHVPGLKIAMPSCANDAYALLRAAVADPDPCIVIESRSLYQSRELVELTDVQEPIGRAKLRRKGSDLVLIAWGTMVGPCLEAAVSLAQDKIEAGVLDLRWIAPLDEKALVEAVMEASGRVLIVHEAVKTGGFAGEVCARLVELVDGDFPLKISRLTTPDVRMPAAPELQAALVPDTNKIIESAKLLLASV